VIPSWWPHLAQKYDTEFIITGWDHTPKLPCIPNFDTPLWHAIELTVFASDAVFKEALV
jgi:hypothetical protein